MDVNEIKSIIEACKETEYSYIKIKNDDVVIELGRKSDQQVVQMVQQPMMPVQPTQTSSTVLPEQLQNSEGISISPVEDKNTVIITSPIVGTYYASPSPEADAFVKIGDRVNEEQTLCIIEAMKLMNEIEAEVNGEVVEIMVDDEAPIEFGQPLFKIKVA